MPLVVQLLLADADPELIGSCKAATGRHAAAMADKMHLLTAQGLYDDLKQQLDDKNSNLRTAGSAFGILAALGTSLNVLGSRTVTAADLPDQMILDSAEEVKESPVTEDLDDVAMGPLCRKVELRPKLPTTVNGCQTPAPGPVPRISNFPGPWFSLPFGCWGSSCVPETCRGGCSQPRVNAVVLFESRCSPELKQTCQPSRLLGVWPGDVASVYEAGSGGWPLCVPHAYVAFNALETKAEAAAHNENAGRGAAALDADDVQYETTVATMQFLKKDDLSQAHFHHISFEADDDEVSLLLATSKTSDGTNLPPWLTSTRIVVPRGSVLGVKHWSPGEVIGCWPPELQVSGGSLYANWVEIACTPRNAPEPMSLLLALPSADIARRLHEAFSATPRPPRPAPSQDGQRAALLCELQLLAKVDLSKDGQDKNCGMSMRRSICEALGIARNRVKVLSVKEGGGSLLGWASVQWSGLQKALQPQTRDDRYYPDV